MSLGTLLRDLLSWIMPVLLFVGVWMWLGRRFAGASGGLMQIGKSKAKVYVEADTGVMPSNRSCAAGTRWSTASRSSSRTRSTARWS